MPLPFLADDHADLGVGLQADQSIDHMHTHLLQFACPADIALLIEAGFELQQHGHLFAAFRGFQQGSTANFARPGRGFV